ncbi:MAG: DUF3035 domain-containing protein [Parvularculaceae bacterium]
MMSVTVFRVALALGAVVAAGGCAGLGKALGNGKNAPDEFAIATKAPLVVPPDYSLRPPRPGETRPQELTPSERARQVLLGDTASAPPSGGEQALLQKAGALGADANIRAVLSAENGGRAEKDRSLANQLMFWKFVDGKVDDSAAPLRVDDPAAWHAERKEAIEAITGEGAEVVIKSDDALSLPGIF